MGIGKVSRYAALLERDLTNNNMLCIDGENTNEEGFHIYERKNIINKISQFDEYICDVNIIENMHGHYDAPILANKIIVSNITPISELEIWNDKTAYLSAVQAIGSNIRFIKNPSAEVQLAAVRQNGGVITFIKNPSIEVQLAAVRNNWCAILHIKHPSKRVRIEAVRQGANPLFCDKFYIINIKCISIRKYIDSILISFV